MFVVCCGLYRSAGYVPQRTSSQILMNGAEQMEGQFKLICIDLDGTLLGPHGDVYKRQIIGYRSPCTLLAAKYNYRLSYNKGS